MIDTQTPPRAEAVPVAVLRLTSAQLFGTLLAAFVAGMLVIGVPVMTIAVPLWREHAQTWQQIVEDYKALNAACQDQAVGPDDMPDQTQLQTPRMPSIHVNLRQRQAHWQANL
ncbi:hypothetical protein [Cupriavidus sp. Agwp_2]|uniref:hypothetical protein n=1 Tax=Cupriavidus sp. Agwp_2 TaxID=2897324 RepID=UPI00345F7A30